ncbi:hypothetical protein [Eubacterium sp.]|uniref:hypothetical protein n=1 Tax=Eubacterium sp. TaxID=142586 RepID=UPI003521E1D0
MLVLVMIVSSVCINNVQAADVETDSYHMLEDEKKQIVDNHKWTNIETVDNYVKEFINDTYKLNNVYSEKVFWIKTKLSYDEVINHLSKWSNYSPLTETFGQAGSVICDDEFRFKYKGYNYYCIYVKNEYKFDNGLTDKLSLDNYFRWKVFRDNIIARTGMNDESLCPEEKIMIYNNYIGRRVISNSDDPGTYNANDIIFKYDLELASDEVNDTLRKNYAEARNKIITTIDKKMARVKNYTDIDTDPDLEAQRNWIKNYDNGTLLGIGQCSSMTGLFNDFMIACGVEVVSVEMPNHIFSVFKNCKGTWSSHENQLTFCLGFGGHDIRLSTKESWDDVTNSNILDWYGITPYNMTASTYNKDGEYYDGSQYKASYNTKYFEQIPATCNTEGKSIVCCALTGEEKVITIPPTHNYELKEYKDATCKENGYIIKKCVDCGYEDTEVIPKRNCSPIVKKEIEYVNRNEGTYKLDYRIVCRDCGKVFEEYTYDLPEETTTTEAQTTENIVTTPEVTTEETVTTEAPTTTVEQTTEKETTENVTTVTEPTTTVETTESPQTTTENEVEPTTSNMEQITSNNETVTTDNIDTTIETNTNKVVTTTNTLTTSKTTKVTKPAKVKKLKTYTKKRKAVKVKLTFRKVKGVKRYKVVVLYKKAAKKHKRTLITKTIKTNRYIIKSRKLKNKKYLYVKVRAYIKHNGKIVYGKWSNIRRVKIKK